MQEFRFSPKTEIESVVQGVMDSLQSPTNDVPGKCATEVLQRFSEISSESALHVLGELAGNLQSFAKTVDLSHPALSWMQGGVFAAGSDFSKELDECCKFADFSKANNLEILPNLVKNFVANKGFAKSLSYYLRKPPISLYKTREKRDALRAYIEPKNFDMGTVGSDCSNYFNLLPDSFSPYIRCGNGFREEIEKNTSTISRLQTLGLKSQSKALSAYNDELSSAVQDTCYGFIRLIFLQASIILAKSLEGKLQDNSVYLPSKIFEPLNILYRLDSPHQVYQPRIYPYNKVPFAITPFVSSLINELEAYAPIGGFPAFDNYYVVVPTIRIPVNDKERPYLKVNGSIKYFDDNWSACKHLDRELVESKTVYPVILGESRIRDGKCYFISYFC